MKNFSYLKPDTLKNAVKAFRKSEDPFYFAGGTDLIALMHDGIIIPGSVIDLKNVSDLDGKIAETDHGLRIGALATMTDLIESTLIKKFIPFLADAARLHSSPGIQNRATIGGNLVNASPAADMAPPLMVLDAILIASKGGKDREIPITRFFKGVKRNSLRSGEILKEIIIPDYKDVKGFFYKKSRIKLVDLAMVNMSIARVKGTFRISIGACAPVPLRIKSAEKVLNNTDVFDPKLIKRVGRICSKKIKPISDLRGSAGYRIELVNVNIQRLLSQLTNTGE